MKLKVNKNWVVLGVAVTVGGIAAFATQRYIKAQVEQLQAPNKGQTMVKVVVAKRPLKIGEKLVAENVALREVPSEWAHSNVITPDRYDSQEGAPLAYEVQTGEPIMLAMLQGKRSDSFSARLAAGQRAVTVPVDEISSLSGMVEPEDVIDLVVSLRKGSRNYTFPLLQKIKVLATGTRVTERGKGSEPERTFTTITLDASPEQAKSVIAAREVGKITALLRHPSDEAPISMKRTDVYELIGLGDPPPNAGVPVIIGGTGPMTVQNGAPESAVPAMNMVTPASR